jgi:hypothetical protein
MILYITAWTSAERKQIDSMILYANYPYDRQLALSFVYFDLG